MDIFTSGAQLAALQKVYDKKQRDLPSLDELKIALAKEKISHLLQQKSDLRDRLVQKGIPRTVKITRQRIQFRGLVFRRPAVSYITYSNGWSLYEVTYLRHDNGGWGGHATSRLTTYGLVLLNSGRIIEVQQMQNGPMIYYANYNIRQSMPPSFIYPKIQTPLQFSRMLIESEDYMNKVQSRWDEWSDTKSIATEAQAHYACAFADTFESQLIALVARHDL